jgi:uncharacterized membrane protein YbhN (UPF0104 family)
MNKQPIYSSSTIQEKIMFRKVLWSFFALMMMVLSLGLVFLSAYLRVPLDLFLIVSVFSLLNIMVAGSLLEQVAKW